MRTGLKTRHANSVSVILTPLIVLFAQMATTPTAGAEPSNVASLNRSRSRRTSHRSSSEMPGVPSAELHRTDVAHHFPGSAALGAFH